MISRDRAEEIAEFAKEFGVEEAEDRYGIHGESVRRYMRLHRDPRGPRVILFDIETSPHTGHFWDVWKQNIHPEQIIEYGQILSYAAKWYGEDSIFFARRGEDDRDLTADLAALLAKADFVVAHNGKAFDIKYVWTRMIYYDMKPPVPYKVIDTCLKARRDFNFPHNSLAGLAKYLGLGEKEEHEGFKLWPRCMADDEEAWKRMERYNIHDVVLLEEVYEKFRAWGRCPNAGLFYDDGELHCPCCGSTDRETLERDAVANVSQYEAYRCESCGKPYRSGSRRARGPVGRNIL